MNALTLQNQKIFAYYLYEIDGSPEGRDLDYWLRAERELGESIFQEDTEYAKTNVQEDQTQRVKISS